MKKRQIVIILIIMVLIVFIGILIGINNKNQNSNNLNTINVSEVTRSVFYSPQYVAINKGFFEANGIDIDLITGQRS